MLRKTFPVVLVAAALIAACTPEPPPPMPMPAPVAQPQPQAEQPDADKEVLVATEPAGAKVMLQGAEVGTTPMKLLVRGNTNVVLEKEGYVKQALMITPDSEPNLVVTLVPSGEGEAEAEEAEVAVGSAGSAGSAKKGKGKKDGEAEPPAETTPEPVASQPPPEAKPPEPPPEPKPVKKTYSNMAQIKAALANGEIDRVEFKKWQRKFQQDRAKELKQLEEDYEAGKIDKAQYKQMARDIKLKYEG